MFVSCMKRFVYFHFTANPLPTPSHYRPPLQEQCPTWSGLPAIQIPSMSLYSKRRAGTVRMVTYVLGVGSGDRFRITSSGSQLGIYTCWGLTSPKPHESRLLRCCLMYLKTKPRSLWIDPKMLHDPGGPRQSPKGMDSSSLLISGENENLVKIIISCGPRIVSSG